MLFHTFGDANKKNIIFIHGMLTPWQMWQASIDHFSKSYFVIVPELDAHTEKSATRFISIENEAAQIKDYLQKLRRKEIFAICGLSMGGRIAAVLASFSEINTEYLVLDGAPLLSTSSILKTIMIRSYLSIIRKTKKRDPKTLNSFKQKFLPEKHLDNYLKIADHIEEQSVINILESICSEFTFTKYDDNCKILFMHGTKGNESISKKSAIKVKRFNPQTEIRCYNGYAHAQLACFEEEKWVSEVCDFFLMKRYINSA